VGRWGSKAIRQYGNRAMVRVRDSVNPSSVMTWGWNEEESPCPHSHPLRHPPEAP